MKSLKFVLFLIGLMVAVLLFMWIFSLFIYVFGNASYTGLISYTPKHIFIFALLVFLYQDGDVKAYVYKLEKIFFGRH
ncbi:MAG: hypothetical protein ACQEP3_01595 [Patescibacteria group bacterium]